MSLTTMAMCWNQRSLLRESIGIGRPRGVRYCVSSGSHRPAASRRPHPHPEHPVSLSQLGAGDLDVSPFRRSAHFENNSIERSISATVKPTAPRIPRFDAPARLLRPPNKLHAHEHDHKHEHHSRLLPVPPSSHACFRPSFRSGDAHPQRIRHDRQRRIHRAARDGRSCRRPRRGCRLRAPCSSRRARRLRIVPEADRAVLMRDAGERNALADEEIAREQALVAS